MFNNNTAWAELMHVCVIASGESAFNAIYSVTKFYQREKKKKNQLYYYKSFAFKLIQGVFGLFKMWRQASKTNKGSFFCFWVCILKRCTRLWQMNTKIENVIKALVLSFYGFVEPKNWISTKIRSWWLKCSEWSFSYNICNKVEKKSQLNLC